MKHQEHPIGNTFSYGLIYIYSISDGSHRGRLKIGATNITYDNPTQEQIEQVAHDRIRDQVQTADIGYNLEYATLAVDNEGKYFSDHDVHAVLIRSGFERKSKNVKNSRSEWFEVGLDVAKNAIDAVKEGRASLTTKERIGNVAPKFEFRPNQLQAIERTSKAIKAGRKHFLWNAKMRFGKTSTALEVVRRHNFHKVLIVTHRPSVNADWFDDFNKVFAGSNYQFSSKDKGEDIAAYINKATPFVYFASLQDLRLSEAVVADEASGSKARGFKKNETVFATEWDMLIVDEAHEGTQSSLGDATLNKIHAGFTLQLSGTPFNIIHKLEEHEIYTWDYVMEQRDKQNWDHENPGIPNPYAELPELKMFTYDIKDFAHDIGRLDGYVDQADGGFRFHEFFRVHRDDEGNEIARFVHESMIKRFLDLLVNEAHATKFPYAAEEYRGYIRHSLWLLPNRTKVIEAMEKLLGDHPVFGKFGIVNISGNARDDDTDIDAKKRVQAAIKQYDYTITLTGQRLTTGASIPEWTAVFMMSDTSSATTYLQTAFRCQTPAKIDGKLKTQGYVFDFAPDRTLKLVAEAIEINHKAGKLNSSEQISAMTEFLNFCPILTAKGGAMKPYDVGGMLEQLKRAVIDRVSRNGFDDPKLYNDELLRLDDVALHQFDELRAIVGSVAGERINKIDVNTTGMTALERKKAEEVEAKKKQKKQLSQEEKEALQKLKEAREQKKTAISILRGVSIRMPMLVYGANVSFRQDISLEMFIDLVDDESWQEFMPAGLTKEKFREFTKYYDEEVFRGVTRNIRAKALDHDDLLPTERVQAIAELFSTFKNPDKETVLTPWSVVNMHMSTTLGGYDFRSGIIQKTGRPEWISKGEATGLWSDEDTRILEINSKSGLYPLLAAYNLYSCRLQKQHQPEEKVARRLWQQVLHDNIFVLCKSPMAKSITQRTLMGYGEGRVNIVYIKDLVNKLRGEGKYSGYNINKELQEKFKLEEDEVKFTAVVGNPPYQVNDDAERESGQTNASASPIYHYFVEASKDIGRFQSLIMPARWTTGAGKGLRGFTEMMLSDRHIRTFMLDRNSRNIFPSVDIKGGVCFYLRDVQYDGEAAITVRQDGGVVEYRGFLDSVGTGTFIPFPELVDIFEKVRKKTPDLAVSSLQKIVSVRKPYGLSTDFFRNQIKYNLPKVNTERESKEDIEIFGLMGGRRESRFVPRNYPVPSGNDAVDTWKVFIPYAYGCGAIGEVIPSPILGSPIQVCTETYLRIGNFTTEFEARALMKYMKSKFLRVMVGILKTTQHSTTTYRFVPLQDFTKSSDIDWTKSIAEIDKQLYVKYGLTDKEIDFIETRVKAMG